MVVWLVSLSSFSSWALVLVGLFLGLGVEESTASGRRAQSFCRRLRARFGMQSPPAHPKASIQCYLRSSRSSTLRQWTPSVGTAVLIRQIFVHVTYKICMMRVVSRECSRAPVF